LFVEYYESALFSLEIACLACLVEYYDSTAESSTAEDPPGSIAVSSIAKLL